jgi:hypothetical protein
MEQHIMEHHTVRELVRDYLGPTCDPSLRLVSREFRVWLNAFKRERLRMEDYFSSFSLLAWALEIGMPGGVVLCRKAAGLGRVDILQWLRAQEPPCLCDASVCVAAAGNGEMEVLKWLRAQEPPCEWDETSCTAAVLGGQPEALRWLLSQNPPCPAGKVATWTAAQEGNLEMLKLLRAHVDVNEGGVDVGVDGEAIGAPGVSGLYAYPPVEWDGEACDVAALGGHLLTLQWMLEQACPIGDSCCWSAARGGHLEVITIIDTITLHIHTNDAYIN